MLTIGVHGVADPKNEGRSHDHALAIMRDGAVLYSLELERRTRIKHDNQLADYIEELIRPHLVKGEPLRFVLANSFLGSNFLSSHGMLELKGAKDLAVPDILARCEGHLEIENKTQPAEFYTICHEMAHIGTCLPFFGDFLPDSLMIHIDGGASDSCASAWYYDGHKITCLDYGWHPALKGAVNNFNASLLTARILGVDLSEHLSMPGKLMGLASFGEPNAELSRWLEQHEWLRSNPNNEDEMKEMIQRNAPIARFQEFSPRDTGCQTMAACMQLHLENQIVAYIQNFRDTTGAKNLYYSGGAALNIHTNIRIEQELNFTSVHIPPAPSDAGLALGAAAYLEWSENKTIQRHTVFLNHCSNKPVPQKPKNIPVLNRLEEAAKAIAKGKIIAVFSDHAEIGPRALGHRSLLARPDSISLRRRLSEQLKEREWYRPVAPMMLPQIAKKALLNFKPDSNLRKYMLGTWSISDDYREAFHGCIHTDGTVRAQVVEADSPELNFIHTLLTQLHEVHGILGLINTSFNTRGAPIVHELDEAIKQSIELGVDMLWLPDF